MKVAHFFQLKKVEESSIRYNNTGEATGEIRIRFISRWFVVKIGMSFVTLNYHTTLPVENRKMEARFRRISDLNMVGLTFVLLEDDKPFEMEEIFIPLEEFEPRVRKALNLEPLPA